MPNWSIQQTSIFNWFKNGKGNLVVRARAGCGKTTTILEGATYAPEQNILVCAFNKVIADELKTRLRNPRATARTLHSVGNSFVYNIWGKAAIDDRRGRKLVIKAMNEQGEKNPPPEMITMVTDLASKAKGMAPLSFMGESGIEAIMNISAQFNIIPDWEFVEDGWTIDILAKFAQRAMQLATENDGTIDFDDMIFLPLACRWTRPRFDMVVVDEAQDMNAAQLMLAQKVCRGRIVVVGDDRQAIYGFRGADSNSIDRLKTELKAVELGLTITYRCPKKVVAYASTIVPDFQAAPEAPEGMLTSLHISNLTDAAGPGNFILSRSNAPLAKICIRLIRAGKRAVIRGRDIGKGLANLVRKLEARDLPELVTKLGEWEKKSIEVLAAQGEDVPESKIEYIHDQADTIRELAAELLTPSELEARIENIFSDANIGSSIICSTVHKAKGLESEKVFALKKTFRPGQNIEEDNLLYVASTRAKSHLVWVLTDE